MRRSKMNQIKSKVGIIAAMFITAVILFTCQLTATEPPRSGNSKEQSKGVDLLKDKSRLIHSYEVKLKKLNAVQNDLNTEIANSKQQLIVTEQQLKSVEHKLRIKLSANASATLSPRDVLADVDSLGTAYQNMKHACDETIGSLEKQIVSKDSSISQQAAIIVMLKDVKALQDSAIANLQEDLKQCEKSQRRLKRQNRCLTVGAALLAGVSSTLLLIHKLR